MGRNIFRKIQGNRTTNTGKTKKIAWSQRFFIFAAVMFLLGWASTGIMISAKDGIDLGFFLNTQKQDISQHSQIQPTPEQSAPAEVSSPLETNSDARANLSSDIIPAAQDEPFEDTSPVPTEIPFSTNIQPQVDNPDNWEDWYCANCVAVPARVKLTHYWPPLGGDNCWTFYDDYCYSPTKSTVPWESIIEIAAACPVPWLGSVVEIPELNLRYLCLDTGDKVVCKDGICVVDVLTDKLYPWDGLDFDAIIYYPRVWVEPAPTFTPTAEIDQ